MKIKYNYIFGNFNSIHMIKWSKYFEFDNTYLSISYEQTKNSKKTKNLFRNKNILFLSSLFNFIFLYFQFLKKRPKKIIIHYINEISLIILILKFIFRYKLIIIPWGSDLNINQGRKITFFKKLICRNCDLIITDGYHIKEKLVNFYKINNKKIKIYNFPINFDDLSKFKKNFRTNPKRMIFSNRSLDKIYSIDILIYAFKKFLKRNPQYKLMIVGDGDLKTELILLVEKLSLSENVVFTGKLNFNEMILNLLNCEIYISSSTTDAGLSSGIAEAIYYKKKIIAANNSDNHIWIKNFDNGLLFKTDDIESLFEKMIIISQNNLNFTEHMYQNFIQKFSYNLIMPKIKDTIDNL